MILIKVKENVHMLDDLY